MTDHTTGGPVTGDSPPQRVLAGRYRLESEIARGGMATVWRATDTVLGRAVAVKMLHPHLAADPSFVARFRQEAVAAARLAHHSIVAIYDTCSTDDGEAIVMELVEGATLRELLDQRGRLDVTTAVEITAKVADALDAAHRAGVVHRDVKPANILLCDDRRVKVADFGIAKAVNQSDLTQQGLMVGTARYLAPEQVEGAPVDGRADVYALGVVLYECLCGRTPFVADNDAAVALARLHTHPLRPRQIRADVPRPVEAVVMRALARQRDDRFASAADLRTALLGALRAPPDDPTTFTTGPYAGGSGSYADPPGTQVGRAPQHTSAGAPSPAAQAPTFAQSERRWLVPALFVVLVAAALGLAGVLLGQTGLGRDLLERARSAVGIEDDEPTDDSVPGGPLVLVAATDFDPEGTGSPGENPEDTANVLDGDPATTWRTEGYNAADFGGSKSGVGLYVAVDGGPLPLEELVVSSASEGWAASVFVADDPADFDDRSEPVATAAGISGDGRFDLYGTEGRYVLVWITHLGAGGDRSRVEISELTVTGG